MKDFFTPGGIPKLIRASKSTLPHDPFQSSSTRMRKTPRGLFAEGSRKDETLAGGRFADNRPKSGKHWLAEARGRIAVNFLSVHILYMPWRVKPSQRYASRGRMAEAVLAGGIARVAL